MKWSPILTFIAVAVFACPGVLAQNPTPAELRELAKENDAKQEELVNLERETARAIQWNNGALFRRIYGDDFIGVLPTGQVKDKAGWISSIESSAPFPGKCALLTSTFTGREAGRPLPARKRFFRADFQIRCRIPSAFA